MKSKQESEPKIEKGKGVEDVEKEDVEEEIEIKKSAICDEHLSKEEIAKFLPIIKDIRKNMPGQDKKEWTKKMAIHLMLTRFGETLTSNGENVVEMEEQVEKGEIEFGEKGFKWITDEENNEGKEQKQSLKIWRVIETQNRGFTKFEPVEITFEPNEIQDIMDKLLFVIENIEESELERIEQEKESERHKSHHHTIKVIK